MMNKEGYIKYKCNWNNIGIDIPSTALGSFSKWRKVLYDYLLIGMYQNGIGYGNISQKDSETAFFITGSATGNKSFLEKSDYSKVTKWDFENNELECFGRTKASSESLSHAAVYDTLKNTGAVIHVHSIKMWNKYKNLLPTTDESMEYGTPALAYEITDLIRRERISEQGIIVMGGHEEGILTFGKNLESAGNVLLKYYNQLSNKSTIS